MTQAIRVKRKISAPQVRPSVLLPPSTEGIGTGAGRTAGSVAPRNLSGAEVRKLMKQPRVRGVAAKEDRAYCGRVYHSKAESLYAFGLDMQKSQRAIFNWKAQVGFPITISGVFICKVIIDFEVEDIEGAPPRYVELKGWLSEVWRLKKKLLLACYPDINLTVVRV